MHLILKGVYFWQCLKMLNWLFQILDGANSSIAIIKQTFQVIKFHNINLYILLFWAASKCIVRIHSGYLNWFINISTVRTTES